MEQRHLGAESWVTLDSVSNTVVLINDKVICENTVNLQFLSEAVSPSFDLLVVLVAPVEARGCRFGACVEADLSLDLNLASRPHCSIYESLNCPRVVFPDRVAILRDFLKVVFDFLLTSRKSEEV